MRPGKHNGRGGLTAPPWLGVNFWSRSGGPRMWTRYDGDIVREELATLAAHGLNVTRSFCFWPAFVPEPERLDADVLRRFEDFLDAHTETGLGTIPTFIVGHMSGENWDPAWRAGRDLYTDVWFVAQQAWFAEEVARRYGGHPAIVGWLVSNEMPLYGGRASEDVIASWARILVQAVRAGGATQPISLGDGAWGVEVSGVDNGYSLRRLAPLIDFLGPHVYPMQNDQLRQLLTPAFVCELCDGFDKPVVLEEFGVSSDFAAAEAACAYYRQVLHSTLLAGARGWIAWNNCDYDNLRDEDPYRHHVFELHFGLTDREGRPKPQLHELADFSQLLDRLALNGWDAVRGEVALVVPEHFERELPFTSPAFRSDMRDALLQAYVTAREADLPVALRRERDGIEGGARLYLAPSTKILTAPGIDRLRALADGGATVYLSAFVGSTDNQRGPWLTDLDELFGVRHTLKYGLANAIEDARIAFEFVEPLGDIEAGEVLWFPVGGTESARTFVPVEQVGAKVIAVDGRGRPALLQHRLGKGTTFFCTYPLEIMAAQTPHANPEGTWRIYSALAEVSGVRRPIRVNDPRVLAGLIRAGDGSAVAVFANWSEEVVDVSPIVTGVALEPAGASFRLDPFAVVTFEAGRLRPTEDDAIAATAASEGGDVGV
jgi:endo-1,4-beta-mannosidase